MNYQRFIHHEKKEETVPQRIWAFIKPEFPGIISSLHVRG